MYILPRKLLSASVPTFQILTISLSFSYLTIYLLCIIYIDIYIYIYIYIYKVFRWKNKNYISKKYFDVLSSVILYKDLINYNFRDFHSEKEKKILLVSCLFGFLFNFYAFIFFIFSIIYIFSNSIIFHYITYLT